jgi:3-oxoacyl-[acyl-carrier protein] reductase
LNEKKIKLIFNKIKKKFGSPYILLNCAGIFSSKNIVQVSKKDINHIFDVNVTLPTLLIKNFISLKLRDKSVGKIINIGSMAGQNGGEFAGELYSMSKASIINLTKSIAKKFGKKNIFCNCINPGPIETSMTKNWPSKIKTNLIKKFKINKKSLGSIDDIVNICVFLSSEKNNFIQGAEINANGGLII